MDTDELGSLAHRIKDEGRCLAQMVNPSQSEERKEQRWTYRKYGLFEPKSKVVLASTMDDKRTYAVVI